MTPKQMTSLLEALPFAQRDIAKKKILLAETVGFTRISLWVWIDRAAASHYDLVGCDAKGRLWFLPETEEVDDLMV